MKIFISWSGELSKLVALELRAWLKKVIQSAEPYMSSKDTSPGARLYSEIYKELEGTKFGISCITAENQENTWINFEAGALAKNTDGRVCPLLIDDLSASVLKAPLNQFKCIYFKREDLQELIRNINESLDDKIDKKLDPDTLDETFNVWWDDFEKKINIIKEEVAIKSKTIKPITKPEIILEELLILCREMNQSIQKLTPPSKRLSDFILSGLLSGEQAVDVSDDNSRVASPFRRPRSQIISEQLDAMGLNIKKPTESPSILTEVEIPPEKEKK